MIIDMTEFNIEKTEPKLFDISKLDLNNTPELKININKTDIPIINSKINSPPKLFEVSNIGLDLLENKQRKKSQSFSMDQDLNSLDLISGSDINLNFDSGFNLFDQLQKNDNSKDRYAKQKHDKSNDKSMELFNMNNFNLDVNNFKNELPNLAKDSIMDINFDLSNNIKNDNISNLDLSLDDLNKKINSEFGNNGNNANNGNNNPQNNKQNIPPKKPDDEKDDLDDLNIDELLSECDTLKTKHNIHIPSHFNRNTPVDEVKAFIRRERRKREKNNSEKLGAKILMTTITALEFLNNKFDPFDLKLDGWSESVHENIDDYNDVFGELYDKYKTTAKVPPEIKLLMMVGGSAAMVHLTNTMFKSSLPGMEEMMKQNPDMMKQFAQAAMNQMGQSVPAGMFGNNNGSSPNKMPPQQSLNQQSQNQFNKPPAQFQKSTMNGPSFNDDINIRKPPSLNPNVSLPKSNNKPTLAPKREMSGPSGVDDILKELATTKPKQSNVKSASPNGSMISKGNNNRRTINLNI